MGTKSLTCIFLKPSIEQLPLRICHSHIDPHHILRSKNVLNIYCRDAIKKNPFVCLLDYCHGVMHHCTPRILFTRNSSGFVAPGDLQKSPNIFDRKTFFLS